MKWLIHNSPPKQKTLTIHEKLELLVKEFILLLGDDGAFLTHSYRIYKVHARQGHLGRTALATETFATTPAVMLEGNTRNENCLNNANKMQRSTHLSTYTHSCLLCARVHGRR